MGKAFKGSGFSVRCVTGLCPAKGEGTKMPGAEKSPGHCVMIEKGNTSFKRECARAGVAQALQSKQKFVCVG